MSIYISSKNCQFISFDRESFLFLSSEFPSRGGIAETEVLWSDFLLWIRVVLNRPLNIIRGKLVKGEQIDFMAEGSTPDHLRIKFSIGSLIFIPVLSNSTLIILSVCLLFLQIVISVRSLGKNCSLSGL